MYRMHAGLVNQLVACQWLEMGIAIESPESKQIQTEQIKKKIAEIKKRKIKFDF